jgi:hypothetical protein
MRKLSTGIDSLPTLDDDESDKRDYKGFVLAMEQWKRAAMNGDPRAQQRLAELSNVYEIGRLIANMLHDGDTLYTFADKDEGRTVPTTALLVEIMLALRARGFDLEMDGEGWKAVKR